jgi:hypothetical protein
MAWLQVYWNKEKTQTLYGQLCPDGPETRTHKDTSRHDRSLGGEAGVSAPAAWLKAMLRANVAEGESVEQTTEFRTTDTDRLVWVLDRCWQSFEPRVRERASLAPECWQPGDFVLFEGRFGIIRFGPQRGEGDSLEMTDPLGQPDWCEWEGVIEEVTTCFSTTLHWVNPTQLRHTLALGEREVWGLAQVDGWSVGCAVLFLNPVVIGAGRIPILEPHGAEGSGPPGHPLR